MMALIGLGLFAAALGVVMAVFWYTLAPALPRIAELLAATGDDGVPLMPPPGSVVTLADRRAMPVVALRAAA